MSKDDAFKAAQKIIKSKLTVKDLSNLNKISQKTQINIKDKETDMLNIEQEMSNSFGHKIEIEAKNKKNGKVSITYNSLDELDIIISKLKN